MIDPRGCSVSSLSILRALHHDLLQVKHLDALTAFPHLSRGAAVIWCPLTSGDPLTPES